MQASSNLKNVRSFLTQILAVSLVIASGVFDETSSLSPTRIYLSIESAYIGTQVPKNRP